VPAVWSPGMKVRLATRGSPLARRQCDVVAHLLAQAHPGVAVEPVVVRTEGDRRQTVPLEQLGGRGVFVKEIQQAVLDGEADIAVHSAKDLPPVTPANLALVAVPTRADPRDALVGSSLKDLGSGARIATGAPRRRVQLANLRPDLTFVLARGNIETRLNLVGRGSADAVVVAVAALDRLHLRPRAAEILAPSVMLPQVGQGAIALECLADAEALRELLEPIDDRDSHSALRAERAMLDAMGASCALPVGAFAQACDGGFELEGMVASGDGRVILRVRSQGADPESLGAEVATRLLAECGGASLLGAGFAP
jgi:hydroxymethylbilane synthase